MRLSKTKSPLKCCLQTGDPREPAESFSPGPKLKSQSTEASDLGASGPRAGEDDDSAQGKKEQISLFFTIFFPGVSKILDNATTLGRTILLTQMQISFSNTLTDSPTNNVLSTRS